MRARARRVNGLWLAALLCATIAVTGCGGAWQELDDVPDMFSFNAVWAFSPSDVWVVGMPKPGGQAAIAHFDGSSWTPTDAQTGALSGMWAFGPDEIWAVGGDTVLRYDGDEWTATSLDAQGARDLKDIWGSAPDDLAAVGDRFFHWDGTSWERQSASGEASAIWGAGADRIWAAGRSDFSQYDGTSWSKFDPDLWGGDSDIWGFGADDVWIAADDEKVAHWDGDSWQLHGNDDIFGDLTAIWGAAPDDVWAAGAFGEIAHWDGETWGSVTRQEMGSPYLMRFHAIHGSSATDVWAVGQVLGAEGNHGIIYRSTE